MYLLQQPSHLARSADLSSEVLQPADLLREILVKLPSKTVFGFTLVSSYWNKTITDPELTCLLKVPRNPSAIFHRRLVLQENDDVVKYIHIPLEGVTRGGRVRVRRSPYVSTRVVQIMIKKVEPTKLLTTWLESCSSKEPRSCGIFQVLAEKPQLHKVEIYPRNGQLLVICKNWALGCCRGIISSSSEAPATRNRRHPVQDHISGT
uniref:F-box domain-containing protein n=1 Tax=Daucus carota subsp. sativus TaxID=79200 RepID=A0A161ZTN2_DAUCS